MEVPYTVGEWKGVRQLRCNLCQFDVLDEGLGDAELMMLEHYVARHVPRIPLEEDPAPPQILVADKSGREVYPAPAPVILPEKPKKRSRSYANPGLDPAGADCEVPGDAPDGELG